MWHGTVKLGKSGLVFLLEGYYVRIVSTSEILHTLGLIAPTCACLTGNSNDTRHLGVFLSTLFAWITIHARGEIGSNPYKSPGSSSILARDFGDYYSQFLSGMFFLIQLVKSAISGQGFQERNVRHRFRSKFWMECSFLH